MITRLPHPKFECGVRRLAAAFLGCFWAGRPRKCRKLAKRKVPLKNFIYGPITPAASSTVRQEITIQSGIAIEKAREIVKKIKDSKIKVQASIQGDLVRVSGKSRDLLQEVIALLRQSDFGIDLQFTNYRTN